jgi:hypothetical protein
LNDDILKLPPDKNSTTFYQVDAAIGAFYPQEAR